MLQHGSYTLLLDACYDREQFPTMEQALEWTWASTPEEVEAVKLILSRFFVLGADGVYTQDRVLEELINYQSKADKNKEIAIERETKRREKSTNRARIVNESPPYEHEPPPNQQPTTSNHKPRKNTAPPDGVALSVWQDFHKTRKTKVTETALNGIRREAEKAGITLEAALNECCARGWQSFKADWVNKAQSTNETTYQRSMREKWETVTGRNSTLTEVYDVTPLALD